MKLQLLLAVNMSLLPTKLLNKMKTPKNQTDFNTEIDKYAQYILNSEKFTLTLNKDSEIYAETSIRYMDLQRLNSALTFVPGEERFIINYITEIVTLNLRVTYYQGMHEIVLGFVILFNLNSISNKNSYVYDFDEINRQTIIINRILHDFFLPFTYNDFSLFSIYNINFVEIQNEYGLKIDYLESKQFMNHLFSWFIRLIDRIEDLFVIFTVIITKPLYNFFIIRIALYEEIKNAKSISPFSEKYEMGRQRNIDRIVRFEDIFANNK